MESGPLPCSPAPLFLGEVSHPSVSVSSHSGPEILPLLGTDWPGHWDHPSISSCFLSTSPRALGVSRAWVGGGCTTDQVGWGCSGQRRRKLRAGAALSPPHLPLYNTPGFPRHKVTVSAYIHCHHMPRLWPPLCHWPPSVPPVTCSYLSSQSCPIKVKVRARLSPLQPNRVAPVSLRVRAKVLLITFHSLTTSSTQSLPTLLQPSWASCWLLSPPQGLSVPSAGIFFLQTSIELPPFPSLGLYENVPFSVRASLATLLKL